MGKGNMDTSTIGKLVAAFVAVMIAVVLIGQIASSGSALTTITPASIIMNIQAAKYTDGATNTSIEFYPQIINDTKTGWRSGINGCDMGATISSIVVRNISGVTFVRGTDYLVSTTNGSLTFQDTNNVNGTLNNLTTVSYTQCPDGYVYGSNWINNGQGNWVCLDWNSGKTMYETSWNNRRRFSGFVRGL
jgi:hypothetical protein